MTDFSSGWSTLISAKTQQMLLCIFVRRYGDGEAERSGWAFTFWIEEFGETQVLLGQVEGVLQVVVSVGLLQFVEINQVWPGNITGIEN